MSWTHHCPCTCSAMSAAASRGSGAQAGDGAVRGLAVGQPVFHDRPRRAERRQRVEPQLAHHAQHLAAFAFIAAEVLQEDVAGDELPAVILPAQLGLVGIEGGRGFHSRIRRRWKGRSGELRGWDRRGAWSWGPMAPRTASKVGQPASPALRRGRGSCVGAGSPAIAGLRSGCAGPPKLPPGDAKGGAWARTDWTERRTAAVRRVLRHIAWVPPTDELPACRIWGSGASMS